MSILIVLLILSFLVIIHELGHFITARWAKIKVEEFGIGFPPVAKVLGTDKYGTQFTLNWLPFGGFVRMFGEDAADSTKAPDSFGAKPVWKRLVVVLAGATINFIFGVLAFGAIYSRFGIPEPLNAVRINEVVANSPAAAAGLQSGTMITQIILANKEGVEIRSAQDFIKLIQDHRGETVTLVDNQGRQTPVYIRTAEETPPNQGSMGVALDDVDLKRYPWYEMPFRGMWVGLKSAVEFGGLILRSLGSMVADLVTKGVVPKDVSGLVGIAHTAEKEDFIREGFWFNLNFAAIISINLAIMNVIPFPALDGGRAFLLLIEGITRRRVNPRIEQWINTAGFAFLITLIILISARDLKRVVEDSAVQQWFKGLFSK